MELGLYTFVENTLLPIQEKHYRLRSVLKTYWKRLNWPMRPVWILWE